MRFLVDENVQIKLIHWLSENGCDAIRVPTGTKNGKILALGLSESRVLITHDHDFSDRLRYPPSKYAGVVLIEIHPPVFSTLIAAFQNLLSNRPSEGFTGKLLILKETGYHFIS